MVGGSIVQNIIPSTQWNKTWHSDERSCLKELKWHSPRTTELCQSRTPPLGVITGALWDWQDPLSDKIPRIPWHPLAQKGTSGRTWCWRSRYMAKWKTLKRLETCPEDCGLRVRCSNASPCTNNMDLRFKGPKWIKEPENSGVQRKAL